MEGLDVCRITAMMPGVEARLTGVSRIWRTRLSGHALSCGPHLGENADGAVM